MSTIVHVNCRKMSEKCCNHHHGCGTTQTLDEMDWERGIWGAAHEGDLERVTSLLQKGRHVDSRDHSGYTALHYAARNGHVELCKLLLDHGAQVDAITREGHATSLQRAAFTGKEAVVCLLLKHGADWSLQDADGKTVLHRAAEGQHLSVCQLLKEMKPELCHIVDKRGQLPVHYALSDSLVDVLKNH